MLGAPAATGHRPHPVGMGPRKRYTGNCHPMPVVMWYALSFHSIRQRSHLRKSRDEYKKCFLLLRATPSAYGPELCGFFLRMARQPNTSAHPRMTFWPLTLTAKMKYAETVVKRGGGRWDGVASGGEVAYSRKPRPRSRRGYLSKPLRGAAASRTFPRYWVHYELSN